jgi:hypothetical protein
LRPIAWSLPPNRSMIAARTLTSFAFIEPQIVERTVDRRM